MKGYVNENFLFVDKLDNTEEEKLAVASDVESIVTLYCKSRNVTYEHENGWADILQSLIALNFSKNELYNCFYAIVTKYIPKLVFSQFIQRSAMFYVMYTIIAYWQSIQSEK
jgi:hypothetical protein